MFTLALIASLAAPPALPLLATIDEKPKPGVIWLPDYSDGRLLARETGKPMLVVFR